MTRDEVFILHNNHSPNPTPPARVCAVDPVDRAQGYGFPGVKVDGNDVEAVFFAAAEACERARSGEGPTLIEAETMRMHGHGAHDDHKYVPREMLEEWSRRDPIERYEEKLRSEGMDVDAIRAAAKELVDEDTDWALAQPMPDPGDATEGVFADRWEPRGDGQAPWSQWSREASHA